MRFTKLQILGVTVCLAGIAGLLPLQYQWIQQKQALASAASIVVPAVAPAPVADVSGHPTRITVPNLGIDLKVIDGTYNARNGAWTLTDYAAQYALPSTLPNNKSGNTLIYGHATKEIFEPLLKATPGTEAHVYTAEGYVFTYVFTSSEAVKPTTTDVFQYTGASRLTLQTCTGTWSQNRQLHYFSFKKYEKV